MSHTPDPQAPMTASFAQLLDALEQGLILLDADLRVLTANRRAFELLLDPAGVHCTAGDPVRSIVTGVISSDATILPEGVGEEEYGALMMSAIRRETRNIELLRRGDTPLRVSCSRLSDGRTLVSIVEHVTQVLKPVGARPELPRRSEDLPVVVAQEGMEVPSQLAEALEFMEEGFALYDSADRLILCNRKFCELLFVDADARPYPGELMDDIVLRAGMTNASKGMPEGMTIEEYAAASTAAFKQLSKKLHFPLDDGKIMEVSGYGTQNGGSLFTLLDVSEREAAAQEAERQRAIAHQSEKLSALGELLAGVAHELNNPLSIVVGFSQMLEAELTEPRQARRIGKIRTAAERSARIVKTFLAMARQRPARMEVASAAQLVNSAVEIAAYAFRADGGQVSVDVPDDLALLRVDKDQIVQVLSNLIVNADQAMKGMSGPAQMTIGASQRAGRVHLTVADNGPGMDENVQRRIFEPFFTTKDVGEGTGFGLAFCHRIVTAHGGELSVESAPGWGSRFTMSLPALTQGELSLIARQGAHDIPSMKILVVDDERDVADLLVEMLRARGHDAQAVYAPFDALRKAQGERFDAVISDMKMPGMTGDELMRRLVETRPNLAGRLGFVTGDSLSRRVNDFLVGGAHPFIEKPIVTEELDALLTQLSRETDR